MTARRATFCIFLPSKILAYCEAMLSLVYIYISQVRTWTPLLCITAHDIIHLIVWVFEPMFVLSNGINHACRRVCKTYVKSWSAFVISVPTLFSSEAWLYYFASSRWAALYVADVNPQHWIKHHSMFSARLVIRGWIIFIPSYSKIYTLFKCKGGHLDGKHNPHTMPM